MVFDFIEFLWCGKCAEVFVSSWWALWKESWGINVAAFDGHQSSSLCKLSYILSLVWSQSPKSLFFSAENSPEENRKPMCQGQIHNRLPIQREREKKRRERSRWSREPLGGLTEKKKIKMMNWKGHPIQHISVETGGSFLWKKPWHTQFATHFYLHWVLLK